MNATVRQQASTPRRQQTPAPVPTPAYLKIRRALLAACIILAPLSISLYFLSWPDNPAAVVNATEASFVTIATMAGPTGNTLHFIGGIAASFFLPLGYLGMSLLGMRRSPGFATICAALSLIGWIPWAALMGIDDLAYDIARTGRTPQLDALWLQFNGDPVMSTYLFIYVVGHLLSAVLIAIMLRRLRLIPLWAAWAFALTSPLTMMLFTVHVPVIRDPLRDLIAVLWIAGAIPAAVAMFKGAEEAPTESGESVG